MTDLSQIPTADLQAFQAGNLQAVSTPSLLALQQLHNDPGSSSPQKGLGYYAGLAGRAISQGLTAPADLMDLPVMGINKALGTNISTESQMLNQGMNQAGFPNPSTPTERVASDVISGVSNPLNLAIPGGFLASGTGSLASGVTREAGGDPLAQLAAGLIGGGVGFGGSKIIDNASEGIKVMGEGITARGGDELDQTAQKIKDLSSSLYKKSEDAGAVLTPDASNKILSSLNNVVPEGHTAASQSLYGKTLSAINGLKSDVENGDVSLQTLDRHRQVLGNLAKDITNPNRAQEAQAAGKAIDAIDDQVKNLKPQDLQNQSTEAVDALTQARAQWSKAKKFEMVSDVIQQAGGDQAKLKSGFSRLLNNDKKMLGLNDAEKEAIRVAATNNMSEKIMKGLGRFGVNPGNVYLPMVAEGLSAMSGHGVAGAGAIAGGTIARQANNLLARGKAEQVLKAIETR